MMRTSRPALFNSIAIVIPVGPEPTINAIGLVMFNSVGQIGLDEKSGEL